MKRNNKATFLCTGAALLVLAGPVCGQTWQQLAPSGTLPGARAIAPSVLDTAQNQMIVFGGFEPTSLATDLWRLSLGASPSWSPISAAGTAPTFVGSAVYDATNSRMILFGGTNSTAVTSETNAVTVLTNANGVNGTPTWITLSPAGADGLAPARVYHSAVYDPGSNRMIIFGGENTGPNSLIYNDVWVLTNANGLGGTPTWIEIFPTGTMPARYGHTAVYDAVNNRMIVFGGNAVLSTSPVPANDVWVLSNANGVSGKPSWTELSPSGTAPAVRAFSQAMFDSSTDSMVLFGGVGSPPVYGDVWALSYANGLGGTPGWTEPVPSGGPAARYGSSGAYNATTNQMFVFGGFNNASTYYNDTWVLNDANSAPAALAISKSHTGNFTQGQQDATYTVSVSNSGAPTSGTVTVTDTLPSGLSLVSMAGAGWACTGTSCTRSDPLAAGANYPAITVTVDVASNAGSPQVNAVMVSGGGSPAATATDSTTINSPPSLSILKTHSGNFTQAQTGATFTVTVSNAAAAGPTSGTVTVTDTIPSGLTFVSMSGTGWNCLGAGCTRSDPLAGGGNYPAITVTVNVSASAPPSVINYATVSGGGSAIAASQDTVTIDSFLSCSLLGFDAVVGGGALVQYCSISNPSNLSLSTSITPAGTPWLGAAISGGSLVVTAAPASVSNPQAGATYSATVTVLASGSPVASATVSLTLTATVGISPNSASLTTAGTPSASFTVTAAGAWAIVNTAPWVTINSPAASAGYCSSGNGSVNYSVATNTAPTTRTAYLTVLSGCPTSGTTFAVATFTITQAAQGGCNQTAVFPQGQQTSFSYSAAGTGANATSVLLNNVCPLTYTAPSWVTIGTTGATSFTFTVAAYTGSAVRSGVIEVGPDTITVSQNPPQCTYSVATTPGFSSTFPAAGGQGSMTVNASAGCSGTVSTSTPSIVEGLSPTSFGGSGPTSTPVLFTVPFNTGPATRGGSVTVKGSGQTFQYAVTQLPPTTNGVAPSYQCSVNPDPVRMLRAEGVAELTSDLVLICTGTSVGAVMGDVIVTFNASVTNHTLSSDTTNSITDALLLNVDVSNPTWALGSNAYSGLVAGPNAIRFPSVSLAPEVGPFTHTFRITNIRVDAARLATALYGQSTAPLVMATVSIQPPLAAPTAGAPFLLSPSTAQTVGQIPFVTEIFGATAHSYASASSSFAAGGVATGNGPGGSYWPLTFTEKQANAFLPALATGQSPSSTPGTRYVSESGFVNLAAFGAETGYSSNGRWGSIGAAMGTRLSVNITNVPCSVALYAPQAPAPASAGDAQLVSADATGAGGYPIVSSAVVGSTTFPGYQFIPLTLTSGATNCPSTAGAAGTGSATVTWEVTSALANSPAALTFDLYANPNGANLSQVGITFSGPIAGAYPGPAPYVTVSAPNSTAPVPRFSAFSNITAGAGPTAALSFFFQPPGSGINGTASLVAPENATAAITAAPMPQTTSGGTCSQTVSATVTNDGSSAASDTVATIQGSGPLSGCFGPTGSTAAYSGSTCTVSLNNTTLNNTPSAGSYQIGATSTSCTPLSYTGYVTSDAGNNDPGDTAGQGGQAPIMVVTPDPSSNPFVQGDTGDTLVVQVQNNGGDGAPGAVTVSGSLPANSGLSLPTNAIIVPTSGYSSYWSCSNTASSWTCNYGPSTNPFPFLAVTEFVPGFAEFTVPFQTITACQSVTYSQTVEVNVNGNQYISIMPQTIAVQGKLQIAPAPANAPPYTALPAATQGKSYTYSGFSVTGGCGGPYTWSITGLPAGLTPGSSGTISGTPTASGAFTVTVTVSDASGVNSQTAKYSLTVGQASTTNVTIQTGPVNLIFTVDGGNPQTAPQTIALSQGSHTIAVATPQAGTAGTQYAFASWNDGGAASHTITVTSSPATYTATFQTQYQLTISAAPPAGGTVSPSTGGYYASGTAVNIAATANTGYTFNNWSGSVANSTGASTSVTMSAPESVTANFTSTANTGSVTIQTNPAGLQFTVDGGAAQTAPKTLTLSLGSHIIAVATPQAGSPPGTQYTLVSWSDGGAASHSITVTSSPATYTATFQTQYQLTISASPASDGTVSPATGAYYSAGTSVPVAATANAGYQFSNWSGSVAGASNASTTVTMSAPETVIANFTTSPGGTPITIQTNPSGLQFTVDGGGPQTSPATINLSPGTHTVAVATPQAGPAGTAAGTEYAFLSWNNGGGASQTITVNSSPATYLATFQTQYQLTISASPFTGGAVSPSTGVYYNAGATVSIGASASAGYTFTNWTGSVASPTSASTTVTMNAPETVVANFAGGGLTFFPVTPCRVVDTRNAAGTFGGPLMNAGSTRVFPIPSGSCGIPSSAQAYSLNVTAVPQSTLNYLTIWPDGQSQPNVSTLNSYTGVIVANAAIVPAGANGAVDVYVTDNTQVILDIDGYFAPSTGLAFYPLAPCRVADTRNANGTFGGPALSAGQTRSFPMQAGSCGIPASAQAYSLNMTVVPAGALEYLTTWPTGSAQPVVSTLNATDGRIVANAAIVPAGTGGAISVYASDATNVIVDVDGYFAPPGSPGALRFYPATPCRVADTRNAAGPFGGPEMSSGSTRSFTIPSSSCGIPTSAQGYSLNVTVVPPGPMGYLTIWPAGSAQPYVSTLNAYNGAVVANAAIVPAGTSPAGAISVFVSDTTQVILDINGYFAP